jgi:hypothetical protein
MYRPARFAGTSETRMKRLAVTLAFALCAFTHSVAHAWFFFWIPTGQIQSAIQGDHCVSEAARPGDKIMANGRQWEVKSTSGASSRCSQTPQWPIIAKLEPVLTEAELKTEMQICAAQGTAAGSRTTVPGVGEVEVISVLGNDCSDTRAPTSVRVVRVKGLELVKRERESLSRASTSPSDPPESPYSTQPTACVSAGAGPREVLEVDGRGRVEIVRVLGPSVQCFAPRRPWLAEVKNFGAPDQQASTPPPQAKPVVDRLRELKQLRDENLITDSVYEAKQKEILSAQ